jgi:predicted PurR-regulated permease PerM
MAHSGQPGWTFGGRGRLLVLAAVVLAVLWLARDVVGPFIVAALLAYAFSPVVSAIQTRTRLPRIVVIAAGYIVVLGAIAVLAFLAAERAGAELRELSSGGPDVIETALRKVVGDKLVIAGQTVPVRDLAVQIRSSLLGLVRTPADAMQMAEQAVGLALQTILCLIVTFYFLLDGRRFGEFALRFLERPQRARALQIASRIHVVLGRWLRGQLLLIALVAVVLYVILGPILHVPYALALAILSGFLEMIPLVGPIIAAGVAGTVAFATRGTDVAIAVLVVYFILRQVEDQIVMPVVIGRAVHLHPVVTIFAVLVGLSAFGVLGGLLGVPVAGALNVTLHELYPDEMARAEAGQARPEAERGPRTVSRGRWVGRRPPAGERPSQARRATRRGAGEEEPSAAKGPASEGPATDNQAAGGSAGSTA